MTDSLLELLVFLKYNTKLASDRLPHLTKSAYFWPLKCNCLIIVGQQTVNCTVNLSAYTSTGWMDAMLLSCNGLLVSVYVEMDNA